MHSEFVHPCTAINSELYAETMGKRKGWLQRVSLSWNSRSFNMAVNDHTKCENNCRDKIPWLHHLGYSPNLTLSGFFFFSETEGIWIKSIIIIIIIIIITITVVISSYRALQNDNQYNFSSKQPFLFTVLSTCCGFFFLVKPSSGLLL